MQFVNHSSVIIETSGRKLLCDLWLDGRAFDDGWALLSKSPVGYQDLGEVTDLWFSHEHPDHFNPPNLKRIPEATRQKIRVLYQETLDHRVIDFCRGLGFGQVEELPPDRWVELAPGVSVLCRPHHAGWGEGDSWLALRAEGQTILNVNDCEIDRREQAEEIRERVGPVDVLLTQFSYASWQGNEEAVDGRRKHARDLLERVKMRAEVWSPKVIVPFASFVRFCHEENVYLNRDMNRVDEVARFIEANTSATAVVLYPGDVWTVGTPHDNAPAIRRYLADLEQAEREPPVKSKAVDEATLVEEARAFCERLVEGADRRVTRLYLGLKTLQSTGRALDAERVLDGARVLASPVAGGLPPAWVWVTDLGKSFAFDLDHGLVAGARPRADCDIALSSEALSYCFRFPWGGETLQVNGRFREPGLKDDSQRWTRANRLLSYFRLARKKSFGHELSAASLAASVGKKVRSRLERVWARR